MRFDLSETQQLLKTSARKFLRAECPMAEVRRLADTATAHDDALWRKIAGQGWTGLLFPEEHDGSGMGMVELAAAMEEMGRALLPGAYLATSVMAGALINAGGTDAQKRKYLAPICRGEARASVALLERSASWSPAAVSLEASSSAGGYRLRGKKLFVQDAGGAAFLVCAARADGGLLLAVVDAGAAGLSLEPLASMDLTRKLYAVDFDNVAVSGDQVLALGDPAQSALERMLDVGAAAVSAEMVGGMQRVLEVSVEYAKTRKQFGRPIGQYQAVQHMCADMLVMVEGARSAAYHAAYSLEEKLPEASLAVSIAKAYTSDSYREVGNRGIQIHGGMGFTWENDLHFYYRRAKASEILFGDAAYHRERIARLAIDKD